MVSYKTGQIMSGLEMVRLDDKARNMQELLIVKLSD